MSRLEKPAAGVKLGEFLILPENRFAAEAVARLGQPTAAGESVPPIYLYGPAGVGKSHLVRQGVQQYLGREPAARVEITTAAQFAADFAEAAVDKTISLFQAATRNVDLLVIEDLQGLDRRRESQIQLLHLCDELISRGGQVVWTSHRSPGDLPSFLRKLVSRFRGGISAQLRPPGPASRIKLLLHFAAGEKLRLPEACARLLAEKLPVSPRELRSVIGQLETLAGQARVPVDLPLVRKFLAHEVTPAKPQLEEVAAAVARQFGISVKRLRSRLQSRDVVYPRQIAMLAARVLAESSLEQIGSFFGGRDHTTVMHACRKLCTQLPTDLELRFHLSLIEAAFGVAEGSIAAWLREHD
jgi:chromosomal replication initiator protein